VFYVINLQDSVRFWRSYCLCCDLCLYVCFSACLCLSVCLLACLKFLHHYAEYTVVFCWKSIHLSVYPSIHPSIHLWCFCPVYLLACLHSCFTVSQSVNESVTVFYGASAKLWIANNLHCVIVDMLVKTTVGNPGREKTAEHHSFEIWLFETSLIFL